MFGNGLRPQIWAEFAKRFNIKVISEFYGATEGNCNISELETGLSAPHSLTGSSSSFPLLAVNIDNHVGAVGFISRIMPFIYPVTLIKVDEVTGEPIRDQRTGLVLRCRPNEDGELVGRIVENHPVREFQG
jgi:solute carrier family 27 fatty acid transporter 1/4